MRVGFLLFPRILFSRRPGFLIVSLLARNLTIRLLRHLATADGENCGLGACVRIGRRSRISASRRNRTQIDADTAHLSCGLVHLGEIAYRTGRVLRFDPKTETFPGDRVANELLTKRYRRPWGYEGA